MNASRSNSSKSPLTYTGRARRSFNMLGRIISIVLTLALFTSSTPAAPQTIVTLAKETSVTFLFWYNANGLAKFLQGQGVGPIKQEKQKDRDARVTRLEISPTDVTIDLSDH